MDGITVSDFVNDFGDGIIIFTPVYNQSNSIIDFSYHTVNAPALELIKKQEEELMGSTLLSAFPNLEDSDLFASYVEVMNSGQSFKKEFHFKSQDLNSWYRNYGFRLGDYLVIQFSDISEYKQVLAEKSRNEGLYQALVRALPNLDLLLVDRNYRSRISKGNPLVAFGVNTTIEVGISLKETVEANTLSEIKDYCQKNFKGKPIRREISLNDTIYRVSFVPAYDHQRVVFGSLIVTEDIGIFNLTEDELRNKLYALENAKESLEQFAYVASHDLQEPLRKIRAFGDRINTKYADKLDETGLDYFSRMQNAAQRMQVLIDDLLKYSRVGRVQSAFEPVDLKQLVNDVLDDLETSIESTGAKIEIGELPTIEGESTQLRQLFQNLLSNAIKFRQDGVTPQIRIQSNRLSTELEGSYKQLLEPYEITVQDNGIGFEEKYLDRIFNIFQRLHGRNQYPGTGIGLAICRKIVDNHQGDIFATSEVGDGAKFHIILPRQQTLQV